MLLTFCAAVHAQAEPGAEHYDGYAEPFGREHAQQKQRELAAISRRVQASLRMASARREAQYADNRRRCHAALRVAAICGKFAGTFTCDEKGFKPTEADAGAAPTVMNRHDRYRMERCALDVARPD